MEANRVVGGWRGGPIAVPGGTGQIGRALCRKLADFPNEVRPLGRGDDLADAFVDAEMVVHLAGTLRPRRPNTYRAANLETVMATVEAVRGSTVCRLVFLSFVSADPSSTNAYLRYKGEAEKLLEGCGVPAVVIKCNHVIGPPDDPGPTARSFLAKNGTVTLLGTGTQRLAPVLREDVVEVLVHAALEPGTPTGRFELAGPDTLTAAELAVALNGQGVRLRRTPPALARLLGHTVPGLTPELVDVMLGDALPVGPPMTFGVEMHGVAQAWARAGAPAAAK